jgi:ABC-type dipeptide/oligopeptide/nickel transport system ATPase component
MRQRAAIAMALACEPKVLLADEPTTALDVMVQAQILELLVGLSDELGLALVLVTHDLPVVAQICQRAAVMHAGDRRDRTTDALFHATRHPYTSCSPPRRPICTATTRWCPFPARRRGWTSGHWLPARPRCDSVIERCEHERPVLLPAHAAAAGHAAACHRRGRGAA